MVYVEKRADNARDVINNRHTSSEIRTVYLTVSRKETVEEKKKSHLRDQSSFEQRFTYSSKAPVGLQEISPGSCASVVSRPEFSLVLTRIILEPCSSLILLNRPNGGTFALDRWIVNTNVEPGINEEKRPDS